MIHPYKYKNLGSAYNSRCVCKDGYLRTAYGVCVPKDSTGKIEKHSAQLSVEGCTASWTFVSEIFQTFTAN